MVMQKIVLELRGIPCLGTEEVEPRKQIIASRSFGERVTDLEPLLEAVSMHATRAGEKLRSQQSLCSAIQVSIKTGKHNPYESYYRKSALVHFSVPTADTRKLINAARRGVQTIYTSGPRYAKAGVMLIDISPACAVQGHLFDREDSEQATQLMSLMDRLNRTYGRRTLFFASEGTQQLWDMKRRRMTKAYTTQWNDIPTVR